MKRVMKEYIKYIRVIL